jgi:hypothetical protein
MRSKWAARVGLGAVAASLFGCPAAPEGECDGAGPVAVEVAPNHGDRSVVVDGGEVAVFIPPQGGVFTELDVAILGARAEGVAALRVRIDDGLRDLADVSFDGDRLPMRCDAEDRLVVDDTPVGLAPDVELESLDDLPATLQVTLDGDEPWQASWEIVLRVTEF